MAIVRPCLIGFMSSFLLTGFLAVAAAAPSAEDSAQVIETSIAYEAKGDYTRALNEIIKLQRATPDDYFVNYRTGWLYYMLGKYSDSIKYYNKASSIAPRALEPKLALLSTLVAARQTPKMEALAQELLKRWPSDYGVRSRLAYSYFTLEKFASALELYQDLVADYPSDVEMLVGLGWTHLKLGKKNDAKEALGRALIIQRSHARAKAGLQAAH